MVSVVVFTRLVSSPMGMLLTSLSTTTIHGDGPSAEGLVHAVQRTYRLLFTDSLAQLQPPSFHVSARRNAR
ncbi:hypothetical protein BD626DRAFT_513956 [Schizophyllum amplum]|uniref:Uncharacterized protein n=1 Tax=Schizophyllum amplum TaxID=97359 RepID=A0A550BYY6_9AGAR|nr:hypothetical protein BD626DRAFT_513956 [Auriculariopsis ampla]